MELACDVLVIGGGLGGVAAALAAAEAGADVLLTEETDWLGGQISAQGVSALDEHMYIERFGGTASYYRLREAIRTHYAPRMKPGTDRPERNPGKGWVSRLCFEPAVGEQVLSAMCGAATVSPHLRLRFGVRPVAVVRDGARIGLVRFGPSDRWEQGSRAALRTAVPDIFAVRPRVVIDATELGDVLPLAGIPHRVGAEGREETGEPLAAEVPDRSATQAFTFCFAVEWRPGEDHRIPQPEGYAFFRDHQPYSLTLQKPDGRDVTYPMFEPRETVRPFWTYRRMVAASQFDDPRYPNDIALINWPGNDYYGGSILGPDPEAVASHLAEARALAMGLLYWLQHEAPRHDGGVGYPEFKLRPDIMDTRSGLSKMPYIREARRIIPLFTVLEQHISASYQPGPRAEPFPDSVGIGWYNIDIHSRRQGDAGVFTRTQPFQIPLGALLSADCPNFIAGAKNIGTTHITNGAYRLHPVEWNIGEAAGSLAAFALARGAALPEVRAEPRLLRGLQDQLVERGVPLCWLVDVGVGHPGFVPLQQLCTRGLPLPDDGLGFDPDGALDSREAVRWVDAMLAAPTAAGREDGAAVRESFLDWARAHPAANRMAAAVRLRELWRDLP